MGPAIAAAKASLAGTAPIGPVGRIQICNGTYAETEPLVLSVPVSIEGGFTCDGDNWVLPPNANGKGYAVDPPTKIQFTAPRGLVVDGTSITRAVSISRLAFVPPNAVLSGVQSAIGVEVVGGAAPTLQHLRITSQASAGTVFGSAAVAVRTGAAPLIVSSIIQPGAGSITSGPTAGLPPVAGSVGVYVGTGAGDTELRSSVVTGGSGTADLDVVATAAVFVHGKKLTIQDTIVAGGQGTATFTPAPNASPLVTAGLLALGTPSTKSTVIVTDSAISGGRARSKTGATSAGVFGGNANVTLDRARVYGGDSDEKIGDGTSATRSSVTYAVLSQTSTITADNSVFHGGGADVDATSRATLFTRGIALDSARLEGRHLTILAGRGVGNAIGVYFAGAGSTSLQSSLISTETSTSLSLFVAKSACFQKKLAMASSLLNVVFVQPEISLGSTLFIAEQGSDCAETSSPNELAQRGFQSTNNRRVVDNAIQAVPDLLHVPGCGASNAACQPTVFPTYPNSGGGVLVGASLTPSCALPLAFRMAGGTPALPKDIVGALRPATDATPGAFQPLCN